MLLHLLDAIQAECTASDIVEFIEVDISSLAQIDDALFARDVKLPANYTLITDPDEAIVKVAATRAEVAEEAAEEAAEAEAPAPETPASEQG
jgi:large subunit ribosomal protein L25